MLRPQDQAHGCPYKIWSLQQLTAALGSMRLAPSAVSEVVNKAKGGHYQLACAAAFEGAHRCDCDTGINHPNQVMPARAASCRLTLFLAVDRIATQSAKA